MIKLIKVKPLDMLRLCAVEFSVYQIIIIFSYLQCHLLLPTVMLFSKNGVQKQNTTFLRKLVKSIVKRDDEQAVFFIQRNV